MNCPHGEVHIWRIELDCAPSEIAMFMAELSPDEQQRAQRFRFPGLRNQWIVARGALRRILGSYLQLTPRAIRFRVGEFGKPELAWPLEKIAFNLTHSCELALLAVAAHGHVGVDAEHTSDDLGVEEMLRSSFAPSEARAILSLPPEKQRGAFFSAWTRKEALVKALGCGLSLSLNRIVVTAGPEEPAQLISFDRDLSGRWSLVDLSEENLAAAVAVEDKDPIVRRFLFSPASA